MPEGRPRLPADVYRDLRGTARSNELTDVMQAYAVAGQALEDGDLRRAIELLEWAKAVAPRSPSIREALGVARYLAREFAAAHRELLAYRRLSGRQDQNHLLADCARAAGRPDKVAEYVDEMGTARVPKDRLAEGLIVLAGDRADRGDLRAALDALSRADLDPERVQPWHPRVWYLAGDLHERLGERERARDYFEAIAAIDPDFMDVDERLAALPGESP
jgi:tetratricopeptide (TPR) repeat protein